MSFTIKTSSILNYRCQFFNQSSSLRKLAVIKDLTFCQSVQSWISHHNYFPGVTQFFRSIINSRGAENGCTCIGGLKDNDARRLCVVNWTGGCLLPPPPHAVSLPPSLPSPSPLSPLLLSPSLPLPFLCANINLHSPQLSGCTAIFISS